MSRCRSRCDCTVADSHNILRNLWFQNPSHHPITHEKVAAKGSKWDALANKYGVPPSLNNQRRVIYVGYWLSNDNIPELVNKWKEANITYVLLTFITQLDATKPLSDAYSMTQAYRALSTVNKRLLRDNFVLGTSYGGGAATLSPYSQTFQQGSYYHNNPELLAQDFIALCSDSDPSLSLDKYFDLDIEHIDDKFDECATFLGKICIELKRLKPNCEISHAPQPPYFLSQYGNVYNKIYNDYKTYFDFFNVQYYNNGPSDNYQQVFIASPEGYGNVAVLQLQQAGIDGSYIVVGKPVNANEGSAGYIPLVPTLGNIIEQAFGNPDLSQWSNSGGVMIWYYNTQNGTSQDNENILSYMSRVSYLH